MSFVEDKNKDKKTFDDGSCTCSMYIVCIAVDDGLLFFPMQF